MFRFVLLLFCWMWALASGGPTSSIPVWMAASDCDPDIDAPVIVYPTQALSAQLSSCSPEPLAVFFIDISAHDACDPNPQIQITAQSPPGASIYWQHPYASTYLIWASAGTHEITITASDASGNTAQENMTLEVSLAEAIEPSLACNDTIVIPLDANCQRLVTADMVLEGEMGCLSDVSFAIEIEDESPANGAQLDGCGIFPYSISEITPLPIPGFTSLFTPSAWRLHADLFGHVTFNPATDSLSFYGGQSSAGFAAAVIPITQAGQITFDRSLSGFSAGVLFSGSLYETNGSVVDFFAASANTTASESWSVLPGQVIVFSLFNPGLPGFDPSAVIKNWQFTYTDWALSDFEPCWGYIDAQDLIPPSLQCPPTADEVQIYEQVQVLQGNLDSSDPQINTAIYSCLIENFNANGLRYYELIELNISTSDYYTFALVSDFSSGDGDMALFQGVFDPENPCSNILAQADVPQAGNPFPGGLSDPFVRITLPLQAGNTYWLLTTSDEPGATGDYQYIVFSDDNGQLAGVSQTALPITYPLFCGDVALIQSHPDSLSWTGEPIYADNCSAVDLNVLNVFENAPDCGVPYILRFFIAYDAKGNSTTCNQRINFRQPTISDVSLPPATVPIECDEVFPTDPFGNPAPEFTGYPFIVTASGIVDLNDSYCSIGATYEDGPLIDVCPLSYKFIRTWNIIDWCNPGQSINYFQIIKIGDFTSPQVSCPLVDLNGDGFPDPLVYPTSPFSCTASFSAPLPVVSDNCSLWEVYTELVTDEVEIIYNNEGLPIDTVTQTVVLATIAADAPNRMVSGIPAGCHRFRFIVTDECGNSSIKECDFCAKDMVNPSAVCVDQLNASLGGNGTLRIFAEQLNEGSFDNCGIERFEIRREIFRDGNCNSVPTYYSPWGEYVDFSCCDVGDLITLELKVIDSAGNEDICWMDFLVEDKVKPMCTPPHEVTVNCNELPYDFDPYDTSELAGLFGTPMVNDNCHATWEELTPIVNLHDCGFGTFIRIFRAVDDSGNFSEGTCQQLISIEEVHNYEIYFPADGGANCGYPNVDTIGINELACDLLAISVEDDFFSASGDECFKIFRTYRVINWCEYDGEASPMLVREDEDCDGQVGDEAVWVLRRPDHTYIDRDNDETNNNPPAGTKPGNCDGTTNPDGYWRQTTSNGYWQYTQRLKVYDTIAPIIQFLSPLAFCTVDNVDCSAEVELIFLTVDNCTPDDLTIEVFYDEYSDGIVDSMITAIFGTYPKWKILQEFPLGMHTLEIVVTDGCGNTSAATIPFEIVDCLSPAPVCINGLVTELMPLPPNTDADGDGDLDGGAITIFAEQFIASSNTDCVEPITYSINKIGEMPDRDQNGIVLTCDDVGVVIVEIYAWDSANNPYAVQPDGTIGGPNYDYCETFLLLQNNLANCNPDQGEGLIAGFVERENGHATPNIDVQLSGSANESITTNQDGFYAFNTLSINYDYTVTPYRDGDDRNGVSTFDIVLINQHILGITPFSSPYKLIAADVNNSGNVSTIDIIEIRKLILSIDVEFSDNTSWRFVPKSYQFPNPSNPWLQDFPEFFSANDLNGQILDVDFVAIKIGDVDLSATTDDLQSITDRNSLSLDLGIEDVSMTPGKTVQLPILLEQAALGCQFSLRWDSKAMEILDVADGLCSDAHFQLFDESLHVSWNGAKMAEAGSELLTLQVKALRSGHLSDYLSLNENAIPGEAYSAALDKYSMQIAFRHANTFTVGQNYPNPFSATTAIPFYLPEAGWLQVQIFDPQGNNVFSLSDWYPKGTHQFILNETDLPGPGLYFYAFTFGNQQVMKKLLKL
ncbi:MAG TPA: T9SS type A sorting domain-containing protein [Saprospiraceae bacterium]|nr:T9SS type A sorting domain-containing protein [Saprospiraceae bacterium]HMQ84121.1 T9SS type A sorting domain-containing protein [Saprospiraceae bacterium]